MAPYRASRQENLREAPTEGLVADMVKQFADPFAFLRELVQNAIDAGASSIHVRVTLRPDGALCTSVTDDGCGMTLETIEGPFLTLFASSKEGVSGKIGKYGVGFMSVFALAPNQVIVETWRAEGCHIVTLERDFTFVVRASPPREGSGTRVSQLIVGKSDTFASHAQRVELALRRWCRHALCPIVLDVVDADGQVVRGAVRIASPLLVPSPVCVAESQGDDTIVVGYEAGSAFLPDATALPEGTGPFAGFYNRGLTLFETTGERFPGLDGLRFKVMSPSLQHTLSRDNVRRDDAFARLLQAVRKLAREALPRKLQARIAQCADEYARTGASADYVAVLVAAVAHLDRSVIVLPLVEPLDGQLTMSVAQLLDRTPRGEPLLTANAADEITHALALAARPVIRAGPAPALLSALFPSGLACASDCHALIQVTPAANDGEQRLLETVEKALRSAGAGVASASLCLATGAAPSLASILVPADEVEQRLASARELAGWRKRWGESRRALLLRRNDDAVELALRRASEGEAEQAGYLLARIVLLEWTGAVEPNANDALLELAMNAALAAQGKP